MYSCTTPNTRVCWSALLQMPSRSVSGGLENVQSKLVAVQHAI